MQTAILCKSGHALHTFFMDVANVDFLITDNIQLFNIMLDGYKFLFDAPHHAEILHYEDWGLSKDLFRKYEAQHGLDKKSRKNRLNPFQHLRQHNKKKWITSSLIVRESVSSIKHPDRRNQLSVRSVEQSDADEMYRMFSSHPDFCDLGDSTNFKTVDDLIEKLDIAQHSRMFVGSSCSWSKITVKCGSSVYPLVNLPYARSIWDEEFLKKEFINQLY